MLLASDVKELAQPESVVVLECRNMEKTLFRQPALTQT